MEVFFTAKQGSSLHKDWFDYQEDREKVIKAYKLFAQEQGIESNITNWNKDLIIVPTKNDLEKFKNQFKKHPCDYVDGKPAYEFKANSKTYKDWNKALQEKEIKSLQEPHLVWYVHSYGRSLSKIIEHEGVLYCKYENNGVTEIAIPNDCTEILGSEYHKVLEILLKESEDKQ